MITFNTAGRDEEVKSWSITVKFRKGITLPGGSTRFAGRNARSTSEFKNGGNTNPDYVSEFPPGRTAGFKFSLLSIATVD